MTDTVSTFPKRRRDPEKDNDRLFVVRPTKCRHGRYAVDESENTVECTICGERLNPMWVLRDLAAEESRDHHRLAALKLALADARSALKWKCGHCHRMNDMTKPMRSRRIER